MSELTIAHPLSGSEIMEAVCDKVKEMLRRDCHLNPSLGYEAFSGTITIKLRLKDCGRLVEVPVEVEFGRPILEEEATALEQAKAYLYEQPPNAVRQDSGQAIPTLVQDAEGRKTIKPVKYARKRDIDDI